MGKQRALPMLGLARRRRRARLNRAHWLSPPSLPDLLTDLDAGWLEWAAAVKTAGAEQRR